MNIIFEPIDDKNRVLVKKMHPSFAQRYFIYSNATCLRQAHGEQNCKIYALYDGDILIGFTFYGTKKSEKAGRTWLYSFMIDMHFQGKGYGSAIFPVLLKRILDERHCHALYLAVHPDNGAAISIYEKYGFTFTSETNRYKEKIMIYVDPIEKAACVLQ